VSAIRLTGSTSGYAEITPSAVAGDVQLVLPSTAGTLDRLNRAGNILQVVESNSSTIQSNSTITYSSLLTASITPASASNKILVYCTISTDVVANTNSYAQVGIYRGTTSGTLLVNTFSGINSGIGSSFPHSVSWLDSPATASSQTYTLAFRKGSSNTTSVSTNGSYNIILLEVAA
jgi:hypothetical protein